MTWGPEDEREHPRSQDTGRWVEKVSAQMARGTEIFDRMPGRLIEEHRLAFLRGTKRVSVEELFTHPEWYEHIEVREPGAGGRWFVPHDIIPSRHPIRGPGINSTPAPRYQFRTGGGVIQPVAMFTVGIDETVTVRPRRYT